MRVFVADVEVIVERDNYRRAAFDRTGVTQYAAVELVSDRFLCVAQGIDIAPVGTLDLTDQLNTPLTNPQATVLGTRLGIGNTVLRGMTVGEVVRFLITEGWIPDKITGRIRCVLVGVVLFDEVP